MKKNKLLVSILSLNALATMVLSLASCSCQLNIETKITVTFGHDDHIDFASGSTTTIYVEKGSTWGNIKTQAPQVNIKSSFTDNWKFDNWFNGSTPLTDSTVLNDNTNITAKAREKIMCNISLTCGENVTFKDGSKSKSIQAKEDLKWSNIISSLPELVFNDGYIFDDWYNGNVKVDPNMIITNNMPTITAKTTNDTNLSKCTWDYLNEAIAEYEASDRDAQDKEKLCSYFTGGDGQAISSLDDFVGIEKTVNVNNQKHRVRIVDYEHDVLADGSNKTAALTFEFADVLSDKNGFALTSMWNDVAGIQLTSNINYLDSTLRYNLVKQGNGKTHYKKDKTQSQETYEGTQWYGCDNDGISQPTHIKTDKVENDMENKSAWEMIIDPATGQPELENMIKPTKQYVATTTSDWTTTADITTDNEYNDPLFIPAGYCYGWNDKDSDKYMKETKPTPFKYYSSYTTQSDKDGGRLKHACGITEKKESKVQILDAQRNDSDDPDKDTNFAGYTYYNDDTKYTVGDKLGTTYWLSSPYANTTTSGWRIIGGGISTSTSAPLGGTYGYDRAYWSAYAIAPCFCI